MYKTFLVVMILSVSVFGQSAGNSGLAFLKLGFGARNIAMGDVGSAASSDVSSLFYNPAKLADNNSSQIMLMHNQWIQDTRSDLLGAETTFWGLPVAFGFNITSVDNIQVRTTASEQPDATFNANFFFGSISTGFHVAENWSVGGTIKYLYEGLYTNEATGWGFDLGVDYKTPIEGLTAAAVIRNLGSMNLLKNEATKLPTEIRIGPAYSFNLSDKFGITAAAEFQKYTPTSDSHINLGAEVVYDHLIALRGGYQSGYESKNFTAGFGLMWGSLGLDYAFQPFMYGLGSANMFSVKFRFD